MDRTPQNHRCCTSRLSQQQLSFFFGIVIEVSHLFCNADCMKWFFQIAMMKTKPVSLHRWINQRSLGDLPHGASHMHLGSVPRQLYSDLQCVRMWNPVETTNHQCHGSIFNFDFTKDGYISACYEAGVYSGFPDILESFRKCWIFS